MTSDSDKQAAEEHLANRFPSSEFKNVYNYLMVINEHAETFFAGLAHERSRTKEKIGEAIAKIKQIRAEHPALGVVEAIIREIGNE